MASRTIKRLIYGTLGVLGAALALFALYLLGETTDRTGDLESQYINILFVNIVGVLALLALTVGNLWRLLGEFRNHIPGAKLKARVVGMFVGLAVVPLLIVFYFSVRFINSGIDNWFSVEVEQGLDDALSLSRAALETRMRNDLGITVSIANQLVGVAPRRLIFELSMMRRESGASEITIFGRNNRIIATSSDRAAGTHHDFDVGSFQRFERIRTTVACQDMTDAMFGDEFGRLDTRAVPRHKVWVFNCLETEIICFHNKEIRTPTKAGINICLQIDAGC